MSDSFLGIKWIELFPGDVKVPYTFTATVCSSATANDGHLPYGTNMSETAGHLVVKGYTSANVLCTSDLINGTPTVSSNVVTCKLDYPTENGSGKYELTMTGKLDNGETFKTMVFLRITAVNEQA